MAVCDSFGSNTLNVPASKISVCEKNMIENFDWSNNGTEAWTWHFMERIISQADFWSRRFADNGAMRYYESYNSMWMLEWKVRFWYDKAGRTYGGFNCPGT